MLDTQLIIGIAAVVSLYIAYDLLMAYIVNNKTDALLTAAANAYDNCRYQECKKCMLKIVRREPENALFNFRLGMAYHALGQVEAAISCLAEACRLDPKYIDTRAVLSEWYYEEADYWRSMLYAKQAIELDRYNYDAHLLLGKCCVALGDTRAADEEVEFFEESGQDSYAYELTECMRKKQ
ncbi:hypothetical protein HP1_001 [Candidatus Termititenax spirochaetophilus]|uniref:Uncharacterized protein n=1 Tax=Candidatus Termititenax spirochaetophilus TaxID=2218522 RepID=A0A388T7E1_9BACT|nr:hypothetical protein HP1_001 [Candidatus Termititenax spirochaetophilus]